MAAWGVFAGFLIVTALLLFFVIWKLRCRKLSEKELQYIFLQWGRIESQFQRDPKLAIMEADKLLDHVLRKKGYIGPLGEKLRMAAALFHDVNIVWNAHKVRNKLAHELEFRISEDEARRVLTQFRAALRDLGINV